MNTSVAFSSAFFLFFFFSKHNKIKGSPFHCNRNIKQRLNFDNSLKTRLSLRFKNMIDIIWFNSLNRMSRGVHHSLKMRGNCGGGAQIDPHLTASEGPIFLILCNIHWNALKGDHRWLSREIVLSQSLPAKPTFQNYLDIFNLKYRDIDPQFLQTSPYLAVLSSSRSDDVTKTVCVSVIILFCFEAYAAWYFKDVTRLYQGF